VLFVSDEAAGGAVSATTETLLFLATLPGWVVVAKLYGLYDRDQHRADHATADDVIDVFHMITIGTWLFFAASWLTGLATPSFPKLLTFWFGALLLVSVGRAFARGWCRGRPNYVENTLILGTGRAAQITARKLRQHPEYGVNVVGFVGGEPFLGASVPRSEVLGTIDDLTELVAAHNVARVVVAFPPESPEETLVRVRMLSEQGVQVDLVPWYFELISSGVDVHAAEGLPLIGLPPIHLPRSSRAIKRAMDVTLSTAALVLLSPLLVAIAAAIRLESGGPVLFRQVRMGGGGRAFQILKFRTMAHDADQRKHEFAHLNKHTDGDAPQMFKILDDPRTTRIGRVLRRYSLDELPQLFNVLKGEMSLVGARPLILEEDRHVEGWARRRLDLKPGMTGLWQVLGRSEIPFDEMVRLDYLYVATWSLWRDCRLLLRTIPLVLKEGRGAY
jgi:exopolysaccharide biosynthesis polyprenyl glycosylphosphotransferase